MDGNTRTYSENRGYFITRMTLLTTVAIFSCLLVGTGLLIYHFAGCQEIPVHASICDHRYHFTSNLSRLQHDTTPLDSSTAPSTTSTSSSTTTASVPEISHQSTSSSDGQPITAQEDDVRLPRSIEPIAYNIRLIPFIFEDNFTFAGTVDIEVRVKEDCDNITLHAVALQIHEAHVQRHEPGASREDDGGDNGGRNARHVRTTSDATGNSGDNREQNEVDNVGDAADDDGAGGDSRGIEIDRQFVVESKQFYVLMFKRKLRAGERYVVRIKFDGVLNDYLQGFYRSSYIVRNETR